MQPFDALKNEILPELVDRRSAAKSLSIWSAASSSGQEAYSIAILLRTHFPQLKKWKIDVLGTDYSDEMVSRTRDGSYSQFEVGRGLPASMLVKHFDRRGLNWQAKAELRNMISARTMNLAEDWRPTLRHDVVFLRNVLIYFDLKTKEQILRRVHQSMRPDGYLFLGGGETLIRMQVPFERTCLGKTVYFRPVTG
jgi:chemotaxis protein methyltransferase CheR